MFFLSATHGLHVKVKLKIKKQPKRAPDCTCYNYSVLSLLTLAFIRVLHKLEPLPYLQLSMTALLISTRKTSKIFPVCRNLFYFFQSSATNIKSLFVFPFLYEFYLEDCFYRRKYKDNQSTPKQ